MALELSKLTPELTGMGADLASRARIQRELVELARRWLTETAPAAACRREGLSDAARAVGAAIPDSEPIDSIVPAPETPPRYTVVGVDGSQIEPDRHGVAYYYLINVGSLVYRHGSGSAPDAQSLPVLGYADEDLYEGDALVSGNLLDVRRDLAEIARVADLCESERGRSATDVPAPIAALIDGTLLLWTLHERSPARQREKAATHCAQMDRIRAAGAALGAFTSRPRRVEVTRLLHLLHVDGDADRAERTRNPLRRVSDRALFATLPPGARSAMFVSPSQVNNHYAEVGHQIHFCYVNVSDVGHQAAVARVEIPEWVACDPARLALLHGAIVAQSRILGDFPYVLARADELAFVAGGEREMLGQLVSESLLRAGLIPTVSPKARQKSLTRASWAARR